MNIASYTVNFSSRALRPFNKAEVIKHWRPKTTTLAWWKFVISWGQVGHCESCEARLDLYATEFCDTCYEHNYCECGQRLEDAAGSPGDGLCRGCD
jgi:hypothetical protein